MLISFQILGFSASVPTQNRGTSCVIINTKQYDIMIDCGEGSYLNWQKAGYKWDKLKYILITHLHLDHIGGLLSLLFYRKIFNIQSNLYLIGPPKLKKFLIDTYKNIDTKINDHLKFINISNKPKIELENKIFLNALKMKHKIPCWGYSLTHKNNKIVFITDTRPNQNAIKLAKDADILIHEATYQHQDKNKAWKHFHSTELQAMQIADSALVKQLILTHFNKDLTDLELLSWTWKGKPCVIFNKKYIL